MPSDSGERRAARGGGSSPAPPPPPPQSENLPCPRCDSTNTKFCYYNNYNLSQPRHFCKSCRRYWTQGGTLRNVPIGGGTRKNSKRSRPSANFSSSSSSTSSSTVTTHDAVSGNPITVADIASKDVNLNENGSFTSLLSSQGHGFLALSGYGYGFEEMGFGFEKGVWPYLEVPNIGGGGVNSGAGSLSTGGCDAWQMNGIVEAGLADGDCLAWPDLAISTPGNGLK